MLVLSQKTDDKIHIGSNITVTILRVKGRTVKVGVEAPADVRVNRDAFVTALAIPQETRRSATIVARHNQPPRKPK
jgi:carbon storage regulator CsrA